MKKPDSIVATLKEIEYETKLPVELKAYDVGKFLKGDLSSKSSFIIKTADDEYAFSQWVSPKRTRSYPFARVYDTLNKKNRVTLIPFCKDEGADGDRDFIQWDTVSLMSLLNVHVIIGYYEKAEKSVKKKQIYKEKITKQVFDYTYAHKQLTDLQQYHSSSLHWNLKQIEQLSVVAQHTLSAYQKIHTKTKVRLHGEGGIHKRIKVIEEDVDKFRDMSRKLAQEAQIREASTDQPKEQTIESKSIITLHNLIGGLYYWTVDECFILDRKLFLVEKKHTRRKPLPSINDIKDAFIKMALLSNIQSLEYNAAAIPHYVATGLTSETIRGHLHSKMNDKELNLFFSDNNVKEKDKKLLLAAIDEARANSFGLFIINSKDAPEMQNNILKVLGA